MSHWYTPAAVKLAKGDLDFDTVDLRVMAVMSNTTCDTEQDAANLAAFTTIDEYDGSGYTEIDLAGAAVNTDTGNDRAEIDYNDGTFGNTVGAGTRNIVGYLYYVRVDGTDANDWPVAFADEAAPYNGNGGELDFAPNAEGLLQVSA